MVLFFYVALNFICSSARKEKFAVLRDNWLNFNCRLLWPAKSEEKNLFSNALLLHNSFCHNLWLWLNFQMIMILSAKSFLRPSMLLYLFRKWVCYDWITNHQILRQNIQLFFYFRLLEIGVKLSVWWTNSNWSWVYLTKSGKYSLSHLKLKIFKNFIISTFNLLILYHSIFYNST